MSLRREDVQPVSKEEQVKRPWKCKRPCQTCGGDGFVLVDVEHSGPEGTWWGTEQQTCPKCDGKVCTRTKPCKSCLGRRSQNKGKRQQSAAFDDLGIQPYRVGGKKRHTGHEENAPGLLRTEVKSGSMANVVATKFAAVLRQSELERPLGDRRPFVALWRPDGSTDTLITFVLSEPDGPEIIAALYEQVVNSGENP